jgi:hypothetical protein
MKIEEKILKVVKSKFQDKEIAGLRFVSKIGESSWSFRFTFRDGDYQSMSEEYIIQYEGVSLVIVDTSKFISPGVFIIEKDLANKVKNKQKQN